MSKHTVTDDDIRAGDWIAAGLVVVGVLVALLLVVVVRLAVKASDDLT